MKLNKLLDNNKNLEILNFYFKGSFIVIVFILVYLFIYNSIDRALTIEDKFNNSIINSYRGK